MDSLSLALLQVDCDSLDHAYGPAGDAPGQLLALVGDDLEARSRAVGYLDAAMLHQGSVYSATAPFVKIVAGLVTDPRTAAAVAGILPWDPEPRPLRVALLDYLALLAQGCRLSVPDEDLLRAVRTAAMTAGPAAWTTRHSATGKPPSPRSWPTPPRSRPSPGNARPSPGCSAR